MKLNKYIFAALITSITLFLGSFSDFLDRISFFKQKTAYELHR
mgnify:CR=1 FL=1